VNGPENRRPRVAAILIADDHGDLRGTSVRLANLQKRRRTLLIKKKEVEGRDGKWKEMEGGGRRE